MQLLTVGVDYANAPFGIRERLALHGPALDATLARLTTRVSEGFVLSTCNRTEAYALVAHAESGARALAEVLAECGAMSTEELLPSLRVHAHRSAVLHLFGVACGIHSMVPGEDQILAQLKDALEHAAAAGTLGAGMHRLGTAALAVGKRVRSETGISRHALSVVSVALREAGAQLGPLSERHVLVVGAGRTAELALKHLAHGRAARCTIVNRGEARAATLSARYGVDVVAWDGLERVMTVSANLVLGCTSAPGFVIDAAMVARAQQARNGAPLVLMDLAMPRDVDPRAADVDGVTLWDIQRLESICRANRALRAREIEHAETIIAEHADRYVAWWTAREVVPTITSLLAHAAEIRDAEVERTLARLPGLSAREQMLVRTLAARVINKLLRDPVAVLKEHPDGATMASGVATLFALPARSADDVRVRPHRDVELLAGMRAVPGDP